MLRAFFMQPEGTDYLVPIKEVPREVWKEIVANKAQVEAWKDLFAIERRKVKESLLKENPTLVVNTAHFGEGVAERILAGLDDLDAATDGVIMHSENYQALRLLRRVCERKMKCLYVDSPYNTGTKDFFYKDRYQHSTWLAMICERLAAARSCMARDGVIFVSIDAIELAHLRKLLEQSFGDSNQLGTLIWKNATDNNPTRIAVEHEYIVCFANDVSAVKSEWKSRYSDAKQLLLDYYEQLKAAAVNHEEMEKEYRQFIKDNAATVGEIERYKFIDEEGPYTGSESVHNPHPGGYDYEIIHPIEKKPMRKPANGYRFPELTMRSEFIEKDRLIYGPDEKRIVKIKLYLRDYVDSLRSVIVLDGRLAAYTIRELFGASPETVFKNPKPVDLLERLVSFASADGDLVTDFVAGSGTTAHAVINVNRQEATRRKFCMVEMADHFDKVLVPRIQKVMFTPEWKDGKPARLPTKEEVDRTPRLVKVLRLESYEDALHNLVTEDTLKREAPRAKAHKDKLGADTYRLSYLVKLPLESSASMLTLAKLEHPFAYTIEVLNEDGPRTEIVDLVETFNFLYGLHVQRLETWVNEKDNGSADKTGRKYRVVKAMNREGRRVLVVWRDMEKLEPRLERQFLEAKFKGEAAFDEMLINGDTATPGFRSLDASFKRLMEEEER